MSLGKFTEKYRLQPIINELLRVHQHANLEEDLDLRDLKTIYLDNAIDDVVQNLEHGLLWAKQENRGLGYLLERTAVKESARDLLAAVDLDCCTKSTAASKSRALSYTAVLSSK